MGIGRSATHSSSSSQRLAAVQPDRDQCLRSRVSERTSGKRGGLDLGVGTMTIGCHSGSGELERRRTLTLSSPTLCPTAPTQISGIQHNPRWILRLVKPLGGHKRSSSTPRRPRRPPRTSSLGARRWI
ncbi:hypothetical protein B0H12DRAFT_618373 [Mycena haematopus]|nr:hypothetical protein B0H12DRAFT_618373 [Mycena haematopus]